MVIDVGKYVDWYIHYHRGRVEPIANSAKTLFAPMHDEAMDDIQNLVNVKNLIANKFNNGDNQSAAAAIDVAEQIADGSLLQSTLDSIATELNSAVDREIVSSQKDSFYDEALQYATMLEQGSAKSQIVKQFLNLLVQALDLTGGYNAQFLAELRRFAKTVTGKNIRYNPGNVTTVSQEQLLKLTKIRDALSKAADRFEQSGQKLSANSFRGTISYIFTQVLGTSLASSIVARGKQDGKVQVEEALIACGFRPEQAKEQANNTENKINIIKTKGLTLNVTEKGKTTTIEIGTDLKMNTLGTQIGEVGWRENIQIIDSTTYGAINFGSPELRTAAYNILAHESQFSNEADYVYNAIAASFLKESLLGANKQEAAQFIIVGGKVYSVLSIIHRLCKKYFDLFEQPFGIEYSKTPESSNAWRGEKGIPNWKWAYKRSSAVTRIINQLQIILYYDDKLLLENLT